VRERSEYTRQKWIAGREGQGRNKGNKDEAEWIIGLGPVILELRYTSN
jgi:hypothetical protein